MWWSAAIGAPGPAAPAAFCSELLGWRVGHEEPGTSVLVAPEDSVYVVFQHAKGYRRPAWRPGPSEQRPMMRVDFQVADLDLSGTEAVRLGATVAAFQPQENVTVVFGPAGHPFWLCRDE
jgi:hypothetical protein